MKREAIGERNFWHMYV